MNESLAQKLAALILALMCFTLTAQAQETPAETPQPTEAPVASAIPDWNALGNIAVMQSGRIKPLDTVARSSMLMICGRQTVKVDGRPMHALQWLMQVMCMPEKADLYRVFLIHDPDIKALLKLGEEDKRWSFLELEPHLQLLSEQVKQAQDVQPHQRNRYQRSVMELYGHLTTYILLKNAIAPAKEPDFGMLLLNMMNLVEKFNQTPDKITDDDVKELNRYKQYCERLANSSNIHFQQCRWDRYSRTSATDKHTCHVKRFSTATS